MRCFVKEMPYSHFLAGIVIEKPNVSWDEIAGLEDAKQMLKERIVLPVKFPVLFTGRSLHGGILLFGVNGF